MRALFYFFSSLRLTIALLFLSILLVFFGTLDQVQYGVYHTQQRYFEALFAFWQYPEQFPGGDKLGWLHLPLPGGYILGPLLIINLLCAHFRYFRARWSKAGIGLIHGGVVLLLVGQLATQVLQKDYFMWIDEGGSANYIESFHEDELVLTKYGSTTNTEVTIPLDVFRRQRGPNQHVQIQHPALPFRLEVLGFLPNAAIVPRSNLQQEAPMMPYDTGIGAEMDLVVFQQEPTYAQNSRNVSTAVVRLTGAEGPLGTWLASNQFRTRGGDGSIRDMFQPQAFTYEGQTYSIDMRYKREYLPARIQLLDFTHERYPGTQIPRNFASHVHILNPTDGTERETLVYMNNPLRFAGYTFYQASFGNLDTASMFQVVSNPARWFPYVSSGIISLGLLVQFILGLAKFAKRQKRDHAAADASAANSTPATPTAR